jgi:phage-related protein
MTKSQNNPRFLLCAQTGETLIVLHGFKEKSRSDYEGAIEVAAHRRDKLQNP